MKKDCCNIKVTETEKGYRVEVTGDEVKTKCKEILEKCGKDNISCSEFFKSCGCKQDEKGIAGAMNHVGFMVDIKSWFDSFD